MNGEEVKRAIASKGFSVSDVARNLEMSPQNLSKQLSLSDIRTGLLERIADAIGVPVTYFFDHKSGSEAIASGDFSAASVHGDASVRADNEGVMMERIRSLEKLVDEKERMIEEKERTIKILMEK